jgi:hypothetical protein
MKKSIFNLIENPNDLPSTNENMSDLYYREILPTREVGDKIENNRLVQKFSNGNISFQWNFDNRTWFIPSRSYFKFTIELTKPEGQTLSLIDKIAPNMGMCPSLLQRIHFKMNNQTISNVSQYIPQTDALGHRINNSSEWLDNTTGNSIDYWEVDQSKRVHEVSADGFIGDNIGLGNVHDAPIESRYTIFDREDLNLQSTWEAKMDNAGIITFAAIAPNVAIYDATANFENGDIVYFTPTAVGGGSLSNIIYGGVVVLTANDTIQLLLSSDLGAVVGVGNDNNWKIEVYRVTEGRAGDYLQADFTDGQAANLRVEYDADESIVGIRDVGGVRVRTWLFQPMNLLTWTDGGGRARGGYMFSDGFVDYEELGTQFRLDNGVKRGIDLAEENADLSMLALSYYYEKFDVTSVITATWTIRGFAGTEMRIDATNLGDQDLRKYIAKGDFISTTRISDLAYREGCMVVLEVGSSYIRLLSTNYEARAAIVVSSIIRWRVKNYNEEVRAVSQVSNNARKKGIFDLCWKPSAMSIFNYPGAIPGGCKFEFELQAVSGDYIYRGIETPAGINLVPVKNGDSPDNDIQNYRLLVKDLKFYCCQVEGPVVGNEEYSYYLNLNEIRAHSKDITSASLVQTNVDVMESSYALAIAFQDIRSSNTTSYSITKFKIGDDEELALQRYSVRFAGISLPQPDAEMKFSDSEELLVNQYLRNQLYTNLYFKQSGGESLQDWKERGIYFYHPFIRSAGNKEQRAYILTKFNQDEQQGKALTNEGLQNMQLYIFEFYRAFALIKMKNGYVYDIKTANQ